MLLFGNKMMYQHIKYVHTVTCRERPGINFYPRYCHRKTKAMFTATPRSCTNAFYNSDDVKRLVWCYLHSHYEINTKIQINVNIIDDLCQERSESFRQIAKNFQEILFVLQRSLCAEICAQKRAVPAFTELRRTHVRFYWVATDTRPLLPSCGGQRPHSPSCGGQRPLSPSCAPVVEDSAGNWKQILSFKLLRQARGDYNAL